MSVNYPYYLPLSQDLFESVRFIDISARPVGPGADQPQKVKDGVPVWTVSALVKLNSSKQETEAFALVAPQEVAERIDGIPELTPIRLVGLAGGKWSRNASDKTSWSFQIEDVQVLK